MKIVLSSEASIISSQASESGSALSAKMDVFLSPREYAFPISFLVCVSLVAGLVAILFPAVLSSVPVLMYGLLI